MSTLILSPDKDTAADNYDRNKGGMNKEQDTPGRSGDRDLNNPNRSKSTDSDRDRSKSGAGDTSRSTDKVGKPQQ